MRIGAPPNTATTSMPRRCPYARSACVTWMHSSRVGVSTSAWTSSSDGSTDSISGSPNAAVDVAAEDLAERLVEANGGEQVDVGLETAGGRVFDAGMDALAPFGRMVAYGISSKEQNQVRTGRLLRRSQSVIGFWLFEALKHPEMVEAPLTELFAHLAAGTLRVVEGETYPLSEARRAHEDMQARRTSGKLLLDPAR